MSSWVLRPAWFSRITWSTFDSSNLRSLVRIVSGEPISPPACIFCACGVLRNAWYSSHRFDAARLARRPGRVEAQRELEERPAVGLGVGLLVGRAHMNRTRRRCSGWSRSRRAGRAAWCRRCSRRQPRRGPRRRSRTGSRARPCPIGRRPRSCRAGEHATHSGGCGFWSGFGQHVAQREVEVLAVVLDAVVAEHRDQRPHGVLPHRRACRGSGGRTGAAR